jgi:uncharacterized membrane protein HdeD (DUF308 family)
MDATPLPDEVGRSFLNAIRSALGVIGLVAVVTGAVILIWPDHTAMVVAGIIAAYAAIAGLVNLGIGVFSGKLGVWPRVGYLVLGLAFLVSSGIAFANLGPFVVGLAIFIGIFIGVTWIVEGVVSLAMLLDGPSKVWTAIYSVISIVAGATLLAAPVWGAQLLWLVVGISLVIMGIVQIVRAVKFPRVWDDSGTNSIN